MKPYNWLEATVVGLLRKQGFFVTFAPEDASLVGTGSVGICDPHLSAAALI
jgi:hypothetical protein